MQSLSTATSIIWRNNRFAQGVAVASSRYLRDRLPAEVAREVFRAFYNDSDPIIPGKAEYHPNKSASSCYPCSRKDDSVWFSGVERALAGPFRGISRDGTSPEIQSLTIYDEHKILVQGELSNRGFIG